jgi:hypothetical protein
MHSRGLLVKVFALVALSVIGLTPTNVRAESATSSTCGSFCVSWGCPGQEELRDMCTSACSYASLGWCDSMDPGCGGFGDAMVKCNLAPIH